MATKMLMGRLGNGTITSAGGVVHRLPSRYGRRYDIALMIAITHGYERVSQCLTAVEQGITALNERQRKALEAGWQALVLGDADQGGTVETTTAPTTTATNTQTNLLLPATAAPTTTTIARTYTYAPKPRALAAVERGILRQVARYVAYRRIGIRVAVACTVDDAVHHGRAAEAADAIYRLTRQIGGQANQLADAYALVGGRVHTAIDPEAQRAVAAHLAGIGRALASVRRAVVAIDQINERFAPQEEEDYDDLDDEATAAQVAPALEIGAAAAAGGD